MNLTAALLLLLSAVIHVSWNLTGKRTATSLSFYLIANLFLLVVLVPALAILDWRGFHLPLIVWFLIACTGVFEVLYYASLANAYRSGEMSVAYPLVRSIPVLFVTAITALFSVGKPVSPLALAGLALVFCGCLLVPIEHPSRLKLTQYIKPVMLLALLAAVGTTGYSLIDNEAMRLMRELPQSRLPAIETALIYSVWQTVSGVIFMLPVCLVTPAQRSEFVSVLRRDARTALALGVAIYGGYVLVLAAMAYAPNLSSVLAFRQASIPLSARAGVLLLKEKAYPMKFIGSLLIFTGLVMVGIG